MCKDLWRIAVVPGVNLEYSDKWGRWVKEERGYVGELLGTGKVEGLGKRIEWQERPPDEVLCAPTFTEQRWVAWNESLV